MKSSTLLAILVLQGLLLSAAVAKGPAGPTTKKQCWCGECTSWSGVWTCDDLLTKCTATCKNCVPVSTGKGAIKYRCRDFLPENCGCKIH